MPDVVTSGRWLGAPGRPLAGWLSRPVTGMPAGGVLLVPPLAYEYWTTYRTYRALAERLAAGGVAALRIDLYGTGSSAGDPWEPDQVGGWQDSIRHGVEHLRAAGCSWVALAGVRAGALMALLEAAAVGADAVLAWSPVQDGRRYVRELTLLGQRPPDDDPRPEATELLVSGGVPFTAATMAELKALSLSGLTGSPAAHVCVLDAEAATGQRLVTALAALGGTVDHDVVPGSETMLGVSCERAKVPADAVETAASWLITHAPPPENRPTPPPLQTVELVWKGVRLREQITTLGGSGLHAVLGGPVDGPAVPDAVVAFLNTGTEHAVGPGRVWVEYARHLNTLGVSTVRLDFRGWGESPPPPNGAVGEAYEPHTKDDIIDAVKGLQDKGFSKVILVGLCQSSWMALQAVKVHPVAGIFALNPEFIWYPGVPVDMTIEEGARWDDRRLRRIRTLQPWRIWTLLDLVGVRGVTGRWLDALARTGVPLLFVYAEGDIGLEHLTLRHGRRLRIARRRGTITVVEVPGIDHQMHREWARNGIIRELEDFVLELTCPQRGHSQGRAESRQRTM